MLPPVPKSNLNIVGTEAKKKPTHIYMTTHTLLAWMKGGGVNTSS
jgi:hypothetical protein